MTSQRAEHAIKPPPSRTPCRVCLLWLITSQCARRLRRACLCGRFDIDFDVFYAFCMKWLQILALIARILTAILKGIASPVTMFMRKRK